MMRVPGLSLLLLLPVSGTAPAQSCRQVEGGSGKAAAVGAAIGKLRSLLNEPQRATLEKPLNYDSAIHWSNLPIGVVPRTGLRLGDLDAKQTAAARQVFEAALSACGQKLLDEVRLADDWLAGYDTRPIGWNGGNYYLTVLGDPAANKPWMLQVGGHHLAYNF